MNEDTLIFIDLDGTLTNTIHPSWEIYRVGQELVDPSLVPLFPTVETFLATARDSGCHIVIVSDSHSRYVNPIAQRLRLPAVSLADKPNTKNILQYINNNEEIHRLFLNKDNCCFIGDTKLDIELGRRLGIKTILISQYFVLKEQTDLRNGIGDKLGNLKMGPTYSLTDFNEVIDVLSDPINTLPAIESAFAGGNSTHAIKFFSKRFPDGTVGAIRCLARQETGGCDRFARADKYYQIANPVRSQEFIEELCIGIDNYLRYLVSDSGQTWDTLSYIADKSTTIPQNKMRQIFESINVPLEKIGCFKWREDGQGSLREQDQYGDRRKFLNSYLKIREDVELKGRNIVVIDDQITTGATAFYALYSLKERGAANIMILPLFQMIFPVSSEKKCPRCGKEMIIKMRRSDGVRFYSCTPPKYRGDGCGYTEDCE